MVIDINQRKMAFGAKYDIFNQGERIRFAQSRLFRILSQIDLLQTEGGGNLLTIEQRFAFLNTSYDIHYPGAAVLEFRTLSFWRGHYRCTSGKNVYDIFSHRGRKYSIYKNTQQVAWWDKQAVTWFEGDNYKITANDDCDVDLIISFCLIVDDKKSSAHGDSAFTINFGKIGPEDRAFNPNWYPKTDKTMHAV